MTPIRQHRVLWKGEPLLVDARVTNERVQVFSVHGIHDRDFKTHVLVDPHGSAEYSVALSAWSQEDREELYRLVLEACGHGDV